MTEVAKHSTQLDEKMAELNSFMAEIPPESRSHIALKDMLFIEINRIAHDQGRRPSAKYGIRLGQVQNRCDIPDYFETYQRLTQFHQELADIDDQKDSRVANKNALKKIMEEAAKFKLIPVESLKLLGE